MKVHVKIHDFLDSDFRNDSGEIIRRDKLLRLKDEKYGTGQLTSNNLPAVDWIGNKSKYADENGFDTRTKDSIIKIVLPKDTIIIRYGLQTGRYTAPDGTDFENLSLPFTRESSPFFIYRVIKKDLDVYVEEKKDIKSGKSKSAVNCSVTKGLIAPYFDSEGGGIQYLHTKPIFKLLSECVIERIPYERYIAQKRKICK